MRPTFHMDTTQFTRDVRRIQAATGKGAGEVVRQWAKVFITYCLKFTPPVGKHPVNEGLGSMRKRGERTLKGDLSKLFMRADRIPEARGSGKPAKALRKYIRQGNQQAINTMLTRLAGRPPTIAAGGNAELGMIHRANRNKRGRVTRNRLDPVLVLDSSGLEQYKKQQAEHVGKAKSGWLVAFRALGAQLPAMGWITRHSSVPGYFRDKSSKPPKHQVWMGNAVAYGGEFNVDRIFRGALKQLTRSMRKSAKAIMTHNLRKSGAATIKVT